MNPPERLQRLRDAACGDLTAVLDALWESPTYRLTQAGITVVTGLSAARVTTSVYLLRQHGAVTCADGRGPMSTVILLIRQDEKRQVETSEEK